MGILEVNHGGTRKNFLTEDKSPDLFSVFFEVTEDNDSVIMAASFGRVCSRGLSSSASLSQLVKTPTPVYGTEGRYAAALYSAASKNKALEAVEKDLKTMTATLGKDAQFAAFLADPSVKENIKADGVAGACDKLKMNVLVAMAENGRHGLVGPVISSFNTIMAAHRGEVICTVSTAKALAAPMKKEVEATIALFLKKGEKSLISYEVKPEIMGGMVVSIGDRFVDMSTASKVKKYTEIIQAAA